MKKIWIAVTLSTGYLFIYALTAFASWSDRLVILMFSLSPFVVLYLVYSILKNGKPSAHTFDERFYDDHNYRRNGSEARNEIDP